MVLFNFKDVFYSSPEGRAGSFGLKDPTTGSMESGEIMAEEEPFGARLSFRLNMDEIAVGSYDTNFNELEIEPGAAAEGKEMMVWFDPDVILPTTAVPTAEILIGETLARHQLNPNWTAAAPFVNCSNGVEVKSQITLCNAWSVPFSFDVLPLARMGLPGPMRRQRSQPTPVPARLKFPTTATVLREAFTSSTRVPLKTPSLFRSGCFRTQVHRALKGLLERRALPESLSPSPPPSASSGFAKRVTVLTRALP